jgi:hypothetical protein
MTCYNSELPIGPAGPVGPQGPQGEPGASANGSYKVYTALLNQSGATAPTAIVLENTLGEINFGYTNEGSYTVTSSDLFTSEKTAIFVSPLSAGSTNGVCVINENDSSEFYLYTILILTGVLSNQLLQNTAIEIRVYN